MVVVVVNNENRNLNIAFFGQMLCQTNFLIGCISEDSQLGKGLIVQVAGLLQCIHYTPEHKQNKHPFNSLGPIFKNSADLRRFFVSLS